MGKSGRFEHLVDQEANEIGIERFESAYYLFFIDIGGDGKLLGKNAVWQVIVFSRLNKVNFFLHIAGSNPVETAISAQVVIKIMPERHK